MRNASKHTGPWPKLSVWHGSADRTVNPANADEIVKQWLDLHELPPAPMSEGMVDGYPREVWWNADGETVVESYTITDMAHGTPLGVADNDERYGAQGAFLIEAGISSSYHIAKFFGLTSWIASARRRLRNWRAPADPAGRADPGARSSIADARSVQSALAADDFAAAPLVAPEHKPRPESKPRRPGVDVGAVITRALTAAGLMQ